MLLRRTFPVYIALALVWLIIAGWQGAEHYRFRRVAYEALLNRGREIAGTMSVVIRSQGRFGLVRQSRLEAALEELARSTDLQSVVLLNTSGQVVASAGKPVGLNLTDLPKRSPVWNPRQTLITIVDLVDLGASAQNDTAPPPAPIVLREGEAPPRPDPNWRPPEPFRNIWNPDRTSSQTTTPPLMPPNPGPIMGRGDRDRDRHPDFSRPFWMEPKRYQELLKKQGLHGFVLQMPTTTFRAEVRHDLWIRLSTMAVALLAVWGMGLAWRSAARLSQLQMRLVRASEMNSHLRELNIAAAGLAHETRNPLNIVRGMAQIISQNAEVPGEIRRKATIITDEVDRVTGRLNQFISYSHSPEPKPARTNLHAVARDVQRALESDQSEKEIHVKTTGPELSVDADESLLRQVIFNLLLNAYEAVGQGGAVEIATIDRGRGEAAFEIRDNGPGVPAELREDIFKPYFTTRSDGTGLGLAVVRQIALAHHWEFEYLPGDNGGAVFRVSAMKVARG